MKLSATLLAALSALSGLAAQLERDIEGRVEGGALRVIVHDCGNKRIVFDEKFGA